MRWWVRRFREPEIIVATVTFLAAALVAAWIVRPFRVGPVGYDAAASVLYFQRITSGQHLEAFLGATPKALLTVVYGTAHAIAPDWRVLSWLAVGAYTAGIAAAAVLAMRLAGVAAAAFVAVGLIASAQLLKDVDLAYAVSWGLLCWAAAGLLVTWNPPRYALAGLALAVGGLARFETLIIVAFAGAALGLGAITAYVHGRSLGPFRARLPVMFGLLTIPLQAIHDWLLTGDPFYAERVPVIGSEGLRLIGVNGALAFIGRNYAPEPVLLLLALIGLIVLIGRRQFDVVVPLLALGPGVWAFLLLLAVRGIYISDRYIAPADLALTALAGIGFATLRMPALAILLRAGGGRVRPMVAAALVGSVAAAAVVRPLGPVDQSTRRTISVNAAVHRDLERATGAVDVAVSRASGAGVSPPEGSPFAPAGSRAILLAPILTVPQLAVDLRLPLYNIVGTVATSISTDGTYPRPGQIVFHDVDRDVPRQPFVIFEVEKPSVVGTITISPLLVDSGHRYWLVEIADAGSLGIPASP